MPTATYHTLGCKVNQYETEQIRLAMERAGFETVGFGSVADVYVINTCTVTAVADAKSRAAIRKARRMNPNARVIVTGCLAQLEPDQIAALDGIDLIVPNSRKDSIPALVAQALAAETNLKSSISDLQLRTRALVKVQDGCDHFCAYCIVPYARPGMRSRPIGEVVEELRGLAEAGYREVVLAGIRLGSYNDDSLRLPGLIGLAAEIDGIERIRLSSIEPWEVDDPLLDVMQHSKVCRHLHIPLQSGDDEILGSMRRPYDSAGFERLVEKVRGRIDGIGVTTDVIVGLPGETNAAFRNTAALVERIGFSRLHVFDIPRGNRLARRECRGRWIQRQRRRARTNSSNWESGVCGRLRNRWSVGRWRCWSSAS